MKIYEILVDTRFTDEYERGQISGIIQAIANDYVEVEVIENAEWSVRFNATEEQSSTIMELLNEHHNKAFVGIREIR